MKFRQFCLVVITVITPFLVKAQAYIQPGVQTALDSFVYYSNQKDWNKAFDLLYPKLFTQVPKQDLVDLMKSMEADGMSLTMDNTKITSTSPPIMEGKETFIRVEYSSQLKAHIKKGSTYGESKTIQALEGQFRSTYGEDNVKWDEGSSEFNILTHKAMMAINNGGKDWKLVEINMDQRELMEFLFPEKIMNTLVLKK